MHVLQDVPDSTPSSPLGSDFAIVLTDTANAPTNTTQDYFGGAEGGAIHNRGDIVVDGEADFTGNFGGVSTTSRSREPSSYSNTDVNHISRGWCWQWVFVLPLSAIDDFRTHFCFGTPDLGAFLVAIVLHEGRPTPVIVIHPAQRQSGRLFFTERRRDLPREVGYVRLQRLRQFHLQQVFRCKFHYSAAVVVFCLPGHLTNPLSSPAGLRPSSVNMTANLTPPHEHPHILTPVLTTIISMLVDENVSTLSVSFLATTVYCSNCACLL